MKIHDLVGQIKDLMDKGIEILRNKKVDIKIAYNFAEIIQAIKETGKKPSLQINGGFNNSDILVCYTDTELINHLSLEDIDQSGEIIFDMLQQIDNNNFKLYFSDESKRLQLNQNIIIQLKESAYKNRNGTSQIYSKIVNEPTIQEGFIIDDNLMTQIMPLNDGLSYNFTTEEFVWSYRNFNDKNWQVMGDGYFTSREGASRFDYNNIIGFHLPDDQCGQQALKYEGKLYNSIKDSYMYFIKLTWFGRDNYSWGDIESNKYKWDLYLFENGDAMIQVKKTCHDWQNTSLCFLGNYIPCSELPVNSYISFYRLNPEGTEWKIDKNIYAWGLD